MSTVRQVKVTPGFQPKQRPKYAPIVKDNDGFDGDEVYRKVPQISQHQAQTRTQNQSTIEKTRLTLPLRPEKKSFMKDEEYCRNSKIRNFDQRYYFNFFLFVVRFISKNFYFG